MEKEEDEKYSVKQEEIHNLLFNRDLGWQEIIYDLINTEQLDPWNINLTILTEKYLEKIQEMEEADFFVSSKVLLAASLLLRIKSEFLLNRYIKSIDEILFGKKEKKSSFERIELEEEIPELIPKSPIPRVRRVTLKELMESLNKAIVTENRRIKKEIVNRNALRETGISLPKKKVNIKDKIKNLYENLLSNFQKDKDLKKISFSKFIGDNREDKIFSFYPLLQLENQKKIWLEQEQHFEEIHIWLKHIYLKHNKDPLLEIQEELEREIEKYNSRRRKKKDVNEDFENPIDDLIEEELD